MTITIRYARVGVDAGIVQTFHKQDFSKHSDGIVHTLKFEDDVRRIRLSNEKLTGDHGTIAAIDLRELKECSELQLLSLDWNALTNIDLSPLASCSNLTHLILHHNKLREIDLSPLASCPSFEKLDLESNRNIESIDLRPLAKCPKFRSLNLAHNRIHSIDLEPLSYCPELSSLDISSNKLSEIDMKPLVHCHKLNKVGLSFNELTKLDLAPLHNCKVYITMVRNQIESIDLTPLVFAVSTLSIDVKTRYAWLPMEFNTVYARPTRTYPWSFLHKVIDKYGSDYRVQQDVLCAMGLGHFGFIDADLQSLLMDIGPDSTLEQACDVAIPVLLQEIIKALDGGGTTAGMDFQKLAAEHGSIATQSERILAEREREVRKLRVNRRRTPLKGLVLTAYGFEIMMALGIPVDFYGNDSHLNQLQSAFADLGYDLKIGKTSRKSVDVSEKLRKAIFWISKNSGKPWAEIKKEALYGTFSIHRAKGRDQWYESEWAIWF